VDCSTTRAVALIWSAIAALLAAIAVAAFWAAAFPLFAAAALVALVAYGLIPAIKNAILAYVACRGASESCSPNLLIDTLGQVAATISAISFAVAGALQIAAIASILSGILSFFGIGTSVAVATLVHSGIVACAIGILLLLGVLTNLYSYKACMDKQDAGVGTPVAGSLEDRH
jgi:hypothetical protein